MASTNQSPQYQAAETRFLAAQTDEQRIPALEEMIKQCPKHKSAEKMLAGLKTRLKKLKQKLDKAKKSGKGKTGIKKADLQACLVGLTNSGKSTILKSITNANPEITLYPYTTKHPNIGTLNHEGVKIQILDLPAIESGFFNQGLANTTDLLLIIVTNLEQLPKIKSFLENTRGNQLIIFNNINNLNQKQLQKIESTLKSKKLNSIIFKKENPEDLKEKIFQQFKVIRIYTKEPHKEPTKEPIVLPTNSTVEDVAKKISKELLATIKETRITGPSSKFPNQKVGIKHVLKDKDIVEFHTR